MKKQILLIALLPLCSCNINNKNSNTITGTDNAKIIGINCDLSSKEMDIEFFAHDIIEPTNANIYTLNINTHYTICVHFEIGGGSIPPSIPVDTFHIDYIKEALNIERIKTENDDDKYLNYITFYDLFICEQINLSPIVFSINDVFSSIILSTY